jgi:hypothetical protein
MTIFNISFEEMFRHMALSIATLAELLEMKVGLFIRYDDILSNASFQIDRIAGFLGHPLSPYQTSKIAQLTSRRRMKKISDHFETLPADRIFAAPGNWAYDTRTLLHRHHVQDSRIGKGRELGPDRRNLVYRAFKDTLDRLDSSLCVIPNQYRLPIDMHLLTPQDVE